MGVKGKFLTQCVSPFQRKEAYLLPLTGTREKTQSSVNTYLFMMIDPLQMGTGHMILDRSLHCKVGWISETCFCMFFSSQTSVIL